MIYCNYFRLSSSEKYLNELPFVFDCIFVVSCYALLTYDNNAVYL